MNKESVIPPHESRTKIYFLSFLSLFKKVSHKVPNNLPVVVKQPFEIDKIHLAKFKRVCGFENTEEVPITYPFVLSFFAQMTLMTHKNFPVPVIGLIHTQNKIRRLDQLREDIPIKIQVSLASYREVKKGKECEIKTTIIQNDKSILESESFYLYRTKEKYQSTKSIFAASHSNIFDVQKSFLVPHDIGKKYAKISGDYNPIHLTNVTARLFGFKKVIAHGMWSKSRALSLLDIAQDNVSEVNFQFCKPIYLPGKVSLSVQSSGSDIKIKLASLNGNEAYLEGDIHLGKLN